MKLETLLKFSVLLVFLSLLAGGEVFAADGTKVDYERARWDPIHFKPAIDSATDEQCLNCHQEILDRKLLTKTQAGVNTAETMAWYQTLTTYEGEQESFHQRHLATPLAKKLMDMKCNTCHQGNNPREEAMLPPDHSDASFTLRKSVNPRICLMCHGQVTTKSWVFPLHGVNPGPCSRITACSVTQGFALQDIRLIFSKPMPLKKRARKIQMSVSAAMADVSGTASPSLTHVTNGRECQKIFPLGLKTGRQSLKQDFRSKPNRPQNSLLQMMRLG